MSEILVAIKEDVTEDIMAPPRTKREVKITIFDRWCKGCGICFTFCPTQAIEADQEGHPVAAHPERCTACQWCVLRCPDLAIHVVQEP